MSAKTLNLNTMSLGDLQKRFAIFGRRGAQLCGRMPDGSDLGQAVKKFFDDLLTSTTDPEKIRQRNEFLARAEKDPVARQQMLAIRVQTINNYVLATVNIQEMFFETQVLADDERPVIQNTTDQEIKISYVGQDGGLKSVKVTKDDDEVMQNLHLLTTDKVNYKRRDIYRGTIVDAALQTLRLAYDIKNQQDARCFTALQAAFGTFRYYKDGGSPLTKKSQYTYLPNSRINIANLPATNDIVLTNNSGVTKFRTDALVAAIQYEAGWQGAFPEGDLKLTNRVLLPAKDATDIAAEFPPSGSTRNKTADEIIEEGCSRVNYLGHDFVIKGDNTLTPGTAYFEMNRKAGIAYSKPSQDREVTKGEDDYEMNERNEEERWVQKVFGTHVNSARRMNVLRVKYRN